MTRIRLDQPARVTVDAFPGVVLHGHVDSWSPASGAQFSLLPPDNATGNFTKVVQRIPVKIVLDRRSFFGRSAQAGNVGASQPSTPARLQPPRYHHRSSRILCSAQTLLNNLEE